MLTRLLRHIGIGLAGLLGLQAATLVTLTILRKLGASRQTERQAPLPTPPPVQIGPNEAQLYPDGELWHQAILEAIAAAHESVWFETFLWHEDELGVAVKEALIARGRGYSGLHHL